MISLGSNKKGIIELLNGIWNKWCVSVRPSYWFEKNDMYIHASCFVLNYYK